MNKNVFDLLGSVLALGIMAAVPAGIFLSYHYDNTTWLLMSVIAFIILAAG